MRMYLSSFGLGNIPEHLVSLLKGKTRVAVILNAKDGSPAEGRAASLETEIQNLAGIGLEPVELDLRDYFGSPTGLAVHLREFDLIWVRGGNTFTLRRAMRQSGFDNLLCELLERDELVYGGFSAAVAVITPSLRGLEIVDDPQACPPGYDPEVIWEGLNILPYAVAPHYASDHPESSAVSKLVQHFIANHILFKALRDGEAIVIDGDKEFVTG